jgi:hypothetical protein
MLLANLQKICNKAFSNAYYMETVKNFRILLIFIQLSISRIIQTYNKTPEF